MTRTLCWTALFAILCTGVALAQEAPTFTVEVGSFPWHDRVGQWALSVVPEQYVSDRPVPQQSCDGRTIVLPEAGAEEVLIGVLATEAERFVADYEALTDTGDRLTIRKGGATLEYAIMRYANPPQKSSFTFSTAGVMLLSWGGELPAPTQPAAPAAPVQPADRGAVAPVRTGFDGPAFTPADGAAPWHDREGQWAIHDLPAQFAGGAAVPQQSCGQRTLVLPEGTTAVTIGVFEGDLDAFRQRYPKIEDTGLAFTINSPGGGGAGLRYVILNFPDPPADGAFKDFTTGGLVLLALNATGGADAPVRTALDAPVRAELEQDQEFVAQQQEGVAGERRVQMWVQEPPGGITPNTGLMLVLHNWGGTYAQASYKAWCRTFADQFNVVAVSVNYLHSGLDWKQHLPYDHGYLQAMDCIGALYTVHKQLTEAGVEFNENRVYAMGGSGGGNVTQMAMKLAPHTFACGVDICGMPGLIDAIAYGGEGTTLNAGYSRDPEAPNYLSPAMQRIRDFGDPEHCRLLHAANPVLTIVIAHGVGDRTCPVVPKIRQFANMVEAGISVDGHFLTEVDVDGSLITTTGHAVGNREQIVLEYAGDYMREDGRFARATTGDSDFTRGGTFEYPTETGAFVIDFSGYPTISFVKR